MSAPDGPLFGPEAVVRRVDAEAALLLGGGRALLMQLAHPLVARGVAEHSDFAKNPFARLQRTLDATYTMVFGTADQARAAAARINAVHDRVVGAGYRAREPKLILWVHATLVDTALRVHARFLGPLPGDDAERYYEESTLLAELLGVPRSDQPKDLAAFRAYVRHMVGSLQVSEEARRVAHQVLHPPVPLLIEPLAGLSRHLSIGLLPAPLRAGYGFGWDPVRQAALDAATVTARTLLPLVPTRLRRVPAMPRSYAGTR
ncbi:MAG TPA: oxygenase MpaB family protein [Acidimicrobiales bacterium]|nr:oxygenase MpaB family protein [Acidimicrobiales bacterium]